MLCAFGQSCIEKYKTKGSSVGGRAVLVGASGNTHKPPMLNKDQRKAMKAFKVCVVRKQELFY